MQIIGLTGGIGSGKSAIAGMLRAAGIPVVDADVLAREVVARGSPGLAAIVERFGADYLNADGDLDRKKLGALVFSDADARRDLNAITHPLVAEALGARIAELEAQGEPRLVYEVPLLFENRLETMMNGTVLVAAPEAVQITRMQARDGLSEEDARARIRAQMPLEEKRKRADFVIENDSTLEVAAARLRAVWKALTGDDVGFAAGPG